MRYFKIEPTPNYTLVYENYSYVKVDEEKEITSLARFKGIGYIDDHFYHIFNCMSDGYWRSKPLIFNNSIKAETRYYDIIQELTEEEFNHVLNKVIVIRELSK